MFKRKVLGVVVSSWALVLAVSVVPVGGMITDGPPVVAGIAYSSLLVVSAAPVHNAGNGGEQSNPEPDNGGGYCIDCNVDRN